MTTMTTTQSLDLVAVAEKVFKEKLSPKQRELLASLDETRNAVWACGRRGGKTRLAALVSLADLFFDPQADRAIEPGDERKSVVVGTNKDQGRILLGYARRMVMRSPMVRSWLVSETQDALVFEHNSRTKILQVAPCSSRGLRGHAYSTATLDEAAHFVVSGEEWDRTVEDVFRAVQPGTAQFGHAGRILIISSPLNDRNWFAKRWARADRGELTGWSAAQVTTAEMNPRVSADYLGELERDEPDTFTAEYLAEFTAGGSQFFDLARATVDDTLEPALASASDSWSTGLDPAVGNDNFALAHVGRGAGDQLVLGPVITIEQRRRARGGWTIEDKAQAWDHALVQVAEQCRCYPGRVFTDQHESQIVTNRLRELGVTAEVIAMNAKPEGSTGSESVKLLAFRELRDRLYSGHLILYKHDSLLEELARVQLKIEANGPKVILPRSAKGHCDMAQAVALAVYKAGGSGGPLTVIRGDRTRTGSPRPYRTHGDLYNNPYRNPLGTTEGGSEFW